MEPFQNFEKLTIKMLSLFLPNVNYGILTFIGTMLAFAATCFLLDKAKNFLPQDQGREFAHDGKLSAGKPRGAGFFLHNIHNIQIYTIKLHRKYFRKPQNASVISFSHGKMPVSKINQPVSMRLGLPYTLRHIQRAVPM